MKSSRSRSRSKSNRNRNTGGGGNVINRVFDSSGPEGKVRGTPQQIIDKYNQLARDAQLSGDRVATENFQQHAEHYMRLLSEAQREMDAKREEQERQNRERQADQERQNRERQAERDRERSRQEQQPQDALQPTVQPDPANEQPEIVDASGDSGLVETPESAPKPKPRSRSRKPKPVKTDHTEPSEDSDPAAEAAK
ncbi:MAG: DUF4167 domain-containing protein [Tateyamaria sp.]|jgi:hypothetical protein|nr:DUF4167 domain-containing protein [Tateyamaria sp.]MDG1335856.1 DUF4167 domain-containing protein [Tateyamaria sp.]